MVIKVKVNGEWIKVPCAVEEAPKDGQQYVRKDGDWSAVEIPEVDLSGIESSIETIETSINELDTNKASKTEVTEQINAAVASVYKVKGSVDSYDALPYHNVSIGDVYNVLDTGANYVATEIELTSPLLDDPTAVQIVTWDKLSETVDLSNLATKTELSDLTTAVDTAVDEVSDKVDTLETSINSIESTLVTDGDGSQYLSNDGTYKTLDLTNGVDGYLLDDAPSDGTTYGRKNGAWTEVTGGGLCNEEYGKIVYDALLNETISTENFNILKTASLNQEETTGRYVYCEYQYMYIGILCMMFVYTGDDHIYVCSDCEHIPSGEDVVLSKTQMCYHFYSDGTVTNEYVSYLEIETKGDGSNVLADNGAYVELPSQSTFSDTSANFEPSATYTDFPYQSRIALEGVTANDFVEVVFGINEALSGNYAPICLTEDGYVTIYSKVSDTITIPTIIIHR